MKALLNAQKKLYPEIIETMHHRYMVLHTIHLFQPIGRRGLAEKMVETERTVRNEIQLLQEQMLIEVTTQGMYVTNEGKKVIEQLAPVIHEMMGINHLEERVKAHLQVDEVIVVAGNSDENDWVKQSMGKVCMTYLKKHLQRSETIAVTGGTTMAAVASAMVPFSEAETCLYVPARGGVGEKVENQANTIAVEMARKAGGEYRLLYAPDPLSDLSYQTMIQEPSIAETLKVIQSADLVLHGIGDAITMATRRRTSETVINKIKREKAVSEAFGYYFDQDGNVVHQVKTLGIQLKDLPATRCVIAIAGGHSKANAITSYFKRGKSNLLITDEGAAKAMLNEF